MRSIFCQLIFIASISNSYGVESSFFMNDSESKIVFEVLSSNKNNSGLKNSNKSFTLSGIFFIDENNWTVWINDKPYSMIGQQKDFSIDEVSDSGVYLTLSDGNTIFLSVGVD